MRRIVLNPTGGPPVAFHGSHLATFRIKAGCFRFAVSMYASKKPSNGLYYVRKEVKAGEQNTEVIFFGSFEDAYSRLKKECLSLGSSSSSLCKRDKTCTLGTCKQKEAVL